MTSQATENVSGTKEVKGYYLRRPQKNASGTNEVSEHDVTGHGKCLGNQRSERVLPPQAAEKCFRIARSVRARLQSCRKELKRIVGFSPWGSSCSNPAAPVLDCVPLRVRRPSATRMALSFGPLIKAGGTDTARVEGIPLMTACANPSVLRPRRPAAERAADAWRFRCARFLLFL
jgi:hypothetical protein